MSSRCKALVHRVAVVAALGVVQSMDAAPVTLANPSFELPSTGFVDTRVDGWTKTPTPAWFDPAATGGVTWDQLSGVFANPAVGQPTRKTNMDGNQGLYLFALPTAGLSQILTTSFEVGMSYELTLGLAGGGGGMPEGTLFALGLFYMDGATPVPVVTQMVSHSTALFPTTTSFVDQSVTLGEVLPGDAWVGKPIGVALGSLSGTGVGYWDLDNVRLEATVVPEPETWALMGAGTVLLGLSVWRRSGRA
jgi:PEP-CTERM motif